MARTRSCCCGRPPRLWLLLLLFVVREDAYFFVSGGDSNNSNDDDDEVSMGTTLVAIRHAAGVVVGADARTSVSGYVSHRFAHKITPILLDNDNNNNNNNNNIVVLRSGSAADTQHLAQVASATFSARQYRYGWTAAQQQPTVSQVAHLMRQLVYAKSETMTVSLLIAGCDGSSDERHDGAGPGRIFSVAPSGALLEEKLYAVSGSGSTYIVGFLDQSIRSSSSAAGMSEARAIRLCHQALELAMQRDGSSGGGATVVSITKDGSRRVDCPPPSAVPAVEQGDTREAPAAVNQPVRLPGFADPVRRSKI